MTLILGLESSCDDSAAALVTGDRRILAQVVVGQNKAHQPFGGVVPEIAARAHVEILPSLIRQVLGEAKLTVGDVDAVAATAGPGLIGGVMVALLAGKGLALAAGKPLIAVNHLEGHALSPRLVDPDLCFPYLLLLVSGGHCQLLEVRGVGDYRRLATTIDDAAGEAFDKSAKMLGLGYPGGPALSRLAQSGDAKAFALPRPLLHNGTLDFSFAGLKTAVMTQRRKLGDEPSASQAADLAASAQEAIVELLVKKSLAALERTGLTRLVVAGGVGANARLRDWLGLECKKRQVRVHYPELALCTDNGAMVAMAAAMRLQAGARAAKDYAFDVRPRWPLDTAALAPA